MEQVNLAPQPLGASKSSVEEYAKKVIDQLGYKKGEDLDKILEELGGKTFTIPPDDLDQTPSMVVDGENSFIINLPLYSNYLRNRFTIAHEIGHYLLHSKQGQIPIEVRRSGDNERVEWEANWFAAAFLMSKNEIEKDWNENGIRDIYTLASIYQVSIEAMQIRLTALGLV
ncbi:MAG: hypothetical protein A2014_04435 [Spirochaetes bacterium GWF1_49_6]|nr:MAG: hypothetical protein A2014_04435 [Spirochaetes bacterium GWF1_49_6]